jgi:hypothetical protein
MSRKKSIQSNLERRQKNYDEWIAKHPELQKAYHRPGSGKRHGRG